MLSKSKNHKALELLEEMHESLQGYNLTSALLRAQLLLLGCVVWLTVQRVSQTIKKEKLTKVKKKIVFPL